MSRKSSAKLPREIFLSHASKDRRFASRIANVLRGHGVPVWYSETNLLGAQQWHDEIGAAVRQWPDRFAGAACLYPFVKENDFRGEVAETWIDLTLD